MKNFIEKRNPSFEKSMEKLMFWDKSIFKNSLNEWWLYDYECRNIVSLINIVIEEWKKHVTCRSDPSKEK